MEQARLAMVNAFDLGYKKEVAPILPYGIYTIREVQWPVSQKHRSKLRVSTTSSAHFMQGNARGQIIGDFDGFLKLLFRADDMKLVGVHAVGEIASEVVHVGLVAMMMVTTHEVFIRTCFNYASRQVVQVRHVRCDGCSTTA